ncbi:MAG: hypothetical protein KDB10_13635, partial [Acidimicrobiales bacterium]|nr:hypothetical protein [Acidimicrobiales bacterium]
MVRRPTLLVTALLAAALSVAPATPGAADANEAPASAPAAGALSIGGLQTCTIVTGGGVRCWGGNTRGELGLGALGSRGGNANQMGGNLEVVGLGTGRTATALSAGTSHTCAVLDTGQVKCWGLNEEGQLGLGNTRSHGLLPRSMGDELPAVDLGTGRTATAVSAGGNHTCAVLDNGAVKCWG